MVNNMVPIERAGGLDELGWVLPVRMDSSGRTSGIARRHLIRLDFFASTFHQGKNEDPIGHEMERIG